jgi:hypothetical protein
MYGLIGSRDYSGGRHVRTAVHALEQGSGEKLSGVVGAAIRGGASPNPEGGACWAPACA